MADITGRSAFAPRMPWRTIVLALLLVALVIAGTVAFIGALQPKLPPPFGVAGNGLIAFEQAGDIVTVDPATAAMRVLVGGPERDGAPVYSNDGTKIAFERDLGPGGRAVFVVKADGSGPIRVTPNPVDDLLDWTFSPDGRALLVTAMVDGRPQIFAVASDASGQPRTLDVRLPASADQAEAPRYRPTDSSQVLVTEWLPGARTRSLSLVDLDAGTTRTLVAPSASSDIFGASWSPNGEWISYGKFDTNADTITARAHVMAADGTGDREVDTLPGTLYAAGPMAWSNDSTRMVLVRGFPPDGSIVRTVVVPIDGTGASLELVCPTSEVASCGEGWSWAPDDRSLLGGIEGDGTTSHYVTADPATGRVTETPWTGDGEGSWQRVAP